MSDHAHIRHILESWTTSELRNLVTEAMNFKSDWVDVIFEMDLLTSKEINDYIAADNTKKGLPADAPFRLCAGAKNAAEEKAAYDIARRGEL